MALPHWKPRLRSAALLALSGSVLGLVVNAVRPHGLPLGYAALKQQGALDPVKRLVGEGKGVALATVQTAMREGTAILVDARPRQDYEAGHLVGAFSIPFNDFGAPFERFRRVFPRETSLIVYCGGGTCTDSVEVLDKLLAQGYVDVKLFPGGWEEWRKAGQPQEKGPDPLSQQKEQH
ncbi:MAG: hypothetical protein COZ06_18150 [Armatimonadetes bacterium CG_4_10_14_3_um_filter_66_18]|nr:rhodanese-like domain-containing protein [Armatimonadota bacterium]OIP11414.1 MAG: hypothetical protein AUJ96_02380 [Armatimonadetes bacterium CG2_30_66_41]PIU93947.1 MAG: hypothetical protein COS65_10200 [Armatimonadetes bacterium CG06_land_8_20_14_3_00_66_21]PIX48435.1 MAG: hypothetical protein COZ57_05575 [Armatimonadetes bacterium CG_4_8_14_3_um_filter_66_20]PIY46983.1 MAG: hypothetical protein COZ06_18150 [Armatimonadetes bacterium CG_4_10_14_3_um_filter_66_18]PIZ40816.1 MAG: hypotheti